MRVEIPGFLQEHEWSCLLASLRMCFAYHGVHLDEDTIGAACGASRFGVSLEQGLTGARRLGFQAQLFFDQDVNWLMERVAFEESVVIPLLLSPVEGRWSRHAVVLAGFDEGNVLIMDPALGAERALTLGTFHASWSALDHAALLIGPR